MAQLDAGLDQYFARITRGWFAAMPANAWSEATLFWAPIGGVIYASTIATDHKGLPHSISLPRDVHDALRDLREYMSDERRGAWISMEARLTSEGVFDANYNWDRRIYWGTHPGNPWVPPQDGSDPVPSDGAYIEELQRHPREPMYIPTWYPRLTEAPGRSQQRFAAQLAARVSLADDLKPLQDAWGWPGVFELIDGSVRLGMTNASDEFAAVLTGRDGTEAQRRALAEFRDGVIGATMASFERGQTFVPLRLWREWAAVRGLAEPAGLDRIEGGQPFAETRSVPPLPAIERDLQWLVGVATQQQLADRFGIAPA